MSATGGVDGLGRRLLPIVRAYLERSGWDVEQHPDEPLLRAVVEAPSGTWPCFVRTREDEQQVVVYSICPRAAPAETRAATSEFLHRVNYGTIVGNFELDCDDGEIRYKTSIDVEGEALADVQLGKLLDVNVRSMSRYLPLLEAVIEGAMTPLQAMEHV